MRIPPMRPLIVIGQCLWPSRCLNSHHPAWMGSLLRRACTLSRRLPVPAAEAVHSCRLHVEKSGAYVGLQKNFYDCFSLKWFNQRILCRRSYCSKPRKTIFSGIQPTGVLHLGNYFGAVRNWVELQEAGENVIYCVVDLHSITLPQDPKTLHSQILSMAASLVACGIDPARAILFQQSRVSEHSQLNWVLGCLTTMARLGHLPQFKEKSESLKEVPLGLYVYPVLQAADILLYRATHVPVGDDQRQHIQLATHLARVFNNKFGPTFVLPRSIVYDDYVSRIRSLRQPAKKMSKSEVDPKSRIELTDSPEVIREKFKKAVTDFTSAIYYDAENRPGVSNIMAIHSSVTGKTYDDIAAECEGIETAQYKLMVADAVIEHLKPIRLTYEDLMGDKGHLNKILDDGAAAAKEIAQKTWLEVKEKVGLSS